jgi:hypothetical protein
MFTNSSCSVRTRLSSIHAAAAASWFCRWRSTFRGWDSEVGGQGLGLRVIVEGLSFGFRV